MRGFVKSASLPFVGQPSLGFGIFDFVLALCRYCMIIPIYICLLLRFLVFLNRNKVIIFLALVYSYIFTINLIHFTSMDFSSYLFLYDFSLEYTVNMDPMEDVIIGESSAMGAANNAGGIPPQFPHDEISIISTYYASNSLQQEDPDTASNPPARNSHQQREIDFFNQPSKNTDNPFHKDWRANEVHERSYGWSDENGREICPVTRQAILPDGYCSQHDSHVCISTDDGNPCNPEKLQGHWDPLLEKTIPIGLRQKVINANSYYNDHYRISYRKAFNTPWDHNAEDRIGGKYLRAWRRTRTATPREADLKIKDLYLNGYEKNHLRNLILKDKETTAFQKWYFRSRNVDYYKLNDRLHFHLERLHQGPLLRNKAKIVRLQKFKEKVLKLNLKYDVLEYFNLK